MNHMHKANSGTHVGNCAAILRVRRFWDRCAFSARIEKLQPAQIHLQLNLHCLECIPFSFTSVCIFCVSVSGAETPVSHICQVMNNRPRYERTKWIQHIIELRAKSKFITVCYIFFCRRMLFLTTQWDNPKTKQFMSNREMPVSVDHLATSLQKKHLV